MYVSEGLNWDQRGSAGGFYTLPPTPAGPYNVAKTRWHAQTANNECNHEQLGPVADRPLGSAACSQYAAHIFMLMVLAVEAVVMIVASKR